MNSSDNPSLDYDHPLRLQRSDQITTIRLDYTDQLRITVIILDCSDQLRLQGSNLITAIRSDHGNHLGLRQSDLNLAIRSYYGISSDYRDHMTG